MICQEVKIFANYQILPWFSQSSQNAANLLVRSPNSSFWLLSSYRICPQPMSPATFPTTHPLSWPFSSGHIFLLFFKTPSTSLSFPLLYAVKSVYIRPLQTSSENLALIVSAQHYLLLLNTATFIHGVTYSSTWHYDGSKQHGSEHSGARVWMNLGSKDDLGQVT
jgi:hypothetical protein